MESVENRMGIDSEWGWNEREEDERLPVCECCGEKIKQYRALHIHHGNIWLCDQCIEDAKEVTVW